jgi:hypothetical protein
VNAPSDFPADPNGAILRQLQERGDALDEPRMVDFSFAFPQRQEAVAFAELVDEPEFQVCISRYEERDMWEATVSRHMVPSYADITALELDLSARAESVGGEPDGWGCLVVKHSEET